MKKIQRIKEAIAYWEKDFAANPTLAVEMKIEELKAMLPKGGSK